MNTANQHIEQLEGERAQVLLGMIDREREKAAYKEILDWCQTVKEAREELTYQRKRDFLHILGVVVIAAKDEEGKLNCRIEIELPEIKELIAQSSGIEDHQSEMRGDWQMSKERAAPGGHISPGAAL